VGTFPGTNGKLNYVTALSGTQTGVRVHSVSDPFTVSCFAPAAPKGLGPMNSNGIYVNVPKNVYGISTRKGAIPAANQPAQTLEVDTRIRVPAGSDSYDPASARAALSAHIAALTAMSASLGDGVVAGQF